MAKYLTYIITFIYHLNTEIGLASPLDMRKTNFFWVVGSNPKASWRVQASTQIKSKS